METWDRGILTNLERRTPVGRAVYALFFIILAFTSIAVLFPFLFALTSGLKGSTEIYESGFNIFPRVPQWSNYIEVWGKYHFIQLFGNTLLVVGGGIIFQLVVSSLAAYSLARLKPIGGRFIMWGFLVTLMIPGIAYIIPQYTVLVKVPILNISLLNNYVGLWLPYAVNAVAIFLMKTFFESIPNELYDAAKVDGASSLRIFWSITLPLSRGILAVLTIIGIINLWKDFLLPMLVLPNPDLQPITVRLYYMLTVRQTPAPLNIQMAASFMAMVPTLIIAVLLQRYLQQGLSIGAVKG